MTGGSFGRVGSSGGSGSTSGPESVPAPTSESSERDETDDMLEAVSASIGDVVVTIEVVDPRYSDLDAAAPALRLADQGLNGALVVGSGVPWRGSLDWSAQVAILRQNGNVVRQTRGGHPLGDLLFLVEWLAGHAQQRGPSLPAGTVITAGTWIGVFEAAAGDTIDVEFPGVGRASARFD